MKDVLGNLINEENILEDNEGRNYKVINKNGDFYAKSLFDDSGYGEYILYETRIERNQFRIKQ